MDTGMLWFDDSPGALSDRLRRAVEYYAQKFGRTPTLCLVNPAMLDKEGPVAGVQVRGARTVMPNHFFLGEERNAKDKRNGKSNGRKQAEGTANGGRTGAPPSARRAKTARGRVRERAGDASA